jgi:hypothetical protein
LASISITITQIINFVITCIVNGCHPIPAAPAPSPTPSPVGGGGSGGTILPSPAPTNIEFTEQVVLKEVAPGQSVVTGIAIKNVLSSTLYNLHLNVEGIPASWVTVIPSALDLAPGETKGFTIGISVPANTPPGDHLTKVKVTDTSFSAENIFMLRIKQYSLLNDQPLFLRTVEINRALGITKVNVTVYNPTSGNLSMIELIENIPTTLAPTLADVTFLTPTDKRLGGNKVEWDISNLLAGESRSVAYTVNKILPEYTGYIYFPLEQANIITESIPHGIKLGDLNIPSLSPASTKELSFTLTNLEENSYNFTVGLKVPEGWKANPSEVLLGLKPSESAKVRFELIIPENATIGTYLAQLEFNWPGGHTIREITLTVQESDFTIVVIIAVVISGIMAAIIYFKRRRRYKNYPRQQILRKIRTTSYQSPSRYKFSRNENILKKIKRQIEN